MDLELLRIGESEQGTFGVLRVGQVPFALTLEQPWRENEPRISCIPDGTYSCERVDSPHFGNTFEVTNVPNRSHILFHKGNILEDTAGCILVGEEFAQATIAESKHGFDEFMAMQGDSDRFQLTIITMA